jgi:lysophospholipase L1-like esterase
MPASDGNIDRTSAVARWMSAEGIRRMTADPRTVLCFGDSLTWGYDPRSGAKMLRYPFVDRWTRRLQPDLGAGYHVIEDGLSGRTTAFEDPVLGDTNGLAHLATALQTHRPLDLVVIFLGTNDAKTFFGVNGDVIARCLGRLLDAVVKSGCGPGGKAPRMLVVVPPTMGNVSGTILEPLFGSTHSRKAIERLRETYPPVAADFGAHCFDINSVVGPGTTDGIHFDPESLPLVAAALATQIRSLFDDRVK